LAQWVAADGLRLRSAHVGGAFALDWRAQRFSDSVVAGHLRRSYALQRHIDFGPPTGQQTCTPLMMMMKCASRQPS
jgi:hypothetical protein